MSKEISSFDWSGNKSSNNIYWNTERLPNYDRTFRFAMESNGYELHQAKWVFNADRLTPLVNEFQGQSVSFFGPNGGGKFFKEVDVSSEKIKIGLNQGSVMHLLDSVLEQDIDQAENLAFLLGGLIRHFSNFDNTYIRKVVDYAASMTSRGDDKSRQAILSSVSMFLISNKYTDTSSEFQHKIDHMARAVSNDPVEQVDTKDLGLSQVARLRYFLETYAGSEPAEFPDIHRELAYFEDFPTVGGEFHFPFSSPHKHQNFYQRFGVLNMSQYHHGSYIQLSRLDHGVNEVRMNPSYYPIAISTWEKMRILLPEINKAHFTSTLNRNGVGKDFSWMNDKDKFFLHRLRTLGMLSYANIMESVPRVSVNEEINFGTMYLGQTVRRIRDDFLFTGNWGGEENDFGQVGVYAGFGDNFPDLSYYLSMAVAKPEILEVIPDKYVYLANTPQGALDIDHTDIYEIFMKLDHRINTDVRLRNAHDAGLEITNKLSE